jgi:hypothetical protein
MGLEVSDRIVDHGLVLGLAARFARARESVEVDHVRSDASEYASRARRAKRKEERRGGRASGG